MTNNTRLKAISEKYFYISIFAPFPVILLPLTFSGGVGQSGYGDYVGAVFVFVFILPLVALNALIANGIAIAVFRKTGYWLTLLIQILIYGLVACSMFGPPGDSKADLELEAIYKSSSKKAGMEVPNAAFCPGNRTPEMTQANFIGLPVEYRNLYHDLPMKKKLEFLCGQLLDQLLEDQSPAEYPQEGRLRLLDNLLNTKQVARNEIGNESKWSGASVFLKKINNADAMAPATRMQLYQFFDQKILQHLTQPDADDAQANDISGVVTQVTYMPTEFAIPVLQTFATQGMLAKQSRGIDSPTVAMEVLRNQGRRIGEMPQPIFDYLLKEAGPNAVNDRELMDTAEGNVQSVQRLLLAGANPAHDGLLASARGAGWNSITYQMMLSAALQPDKGSHAKAILPPQEADLILHRALENCDEIDWNEIDFLTLHGADITRSFQNDPSEPIAHYARRCPENFKKFVSRGLRMDIAYDSAAPFGNNENVPLMLYILSAESEPRPDIVEAMLRQSNNANGPSKCDPCNEYPLTLALEEETPSIVQVLLNYGADPNKLNKNGQAVFSVAAVKNNVALLDMMQSKTKLNVNQKDASGISPLAWAICSGATDAADWLRRHGAVSSGQDICEKETAKESDDAKQK